MLFMCCVVRCMCEVVRCCYVEYYDYFYVYVMFFFFQAEDGIRDLVRSRGLGDVYKRQGKCKSSKT